MLKHCQTVAVEARPLSEAPDSSTFQLLPPEFELCTDTISLSSGSGSSSPTLSYIREMSLDLERKKSSLTAPFSSLASLSQISFLSTSWKFSPVSSQSSVSECPSLQLGLLRSRGASLFTPVKEEKDQESPVLVQCRWFDSPVPDMKEKLDSQNAAICDTPFQNTIEEETHVYATVVEVMQGEYDKKKEVTEHKLENIKMKEYPSSLEIIYSKSKHMNQSKHVISESEPKLDKTKEVCNEKSMTMKVYAKCLGKDIEYKTVAVGESMTSRELVKMLLTKCRMKHKDTKLFYLTMDVMVKKTGIPLKRTLVLDEDSRPAQLRSCNPWEECKFSLQMRKGGLVRVYDSVLLVELKYKCLCISENTTVKEVISMLLNCYGIEETEDVSCFCIYETGHGVERKCNENEKPLTIQSDWTSSSGYHKFVLRKATRSVANQFPEETCVDQSDKLCWGYASTESAGSTCSEVENAFYPPAGSLDSFSVQDTLLAPTLFGPYIPPLTYSTLSAPNPEIILPKSAFIPLRKPGMYISLFNPRVIKKSSFGSVTSATTSEDSDHFFYI